MSSSPPSMPKMTPMVPTISSRAPKEPMSPTLSRQSKPAGRVTGSSSRPTDAARLPCIATTRADAPGGAECASPGPGTVSSAHSTMAAMRMTEPTSLTKRVAARHATRPTTGACGMR